MRILPMLSLTAVLGGACVISPAASAAAALWMDDSPVRHFTDQDWDMFKGNVRDALDNAADGETRSWKNVASGNHGSSTPISSSEKDGRRCRQLKVVNQAKTLTGGGTFEFCANDKGEWRAVNERASKK